MLCNLDLIHFFLFFSAVNVNYGLYISSCPSDCRCPKFGVIPEDNPENDECYHENNFFDSFHRQPITYKEQVEYDQVSF
jgi:hypothetical protein